MKGFIKTIKVIGEKKGEAPTSPFYCSINQNYYMITLTKITHLSTKVKFFVQINQFN